MDAVDDFSLWVEQNGQGPVVWLSGELDIATAPLLRDCLEGLDGQRVTLDLSALTFLDSAGLSVLARRHRDVDGGLVLRGVRPAQMRVFAITGLDDVLIFDGT